VLEVSRLRIAREDKVILRGLSWRVEPGQHWVILGPNGSGKSSLLAALTGYFAPTSGSLAVLGETFGRSDWRELRRRIGLVGPSVAAMIQPAEPALAVVAGGVDGLINLWRRSCSPAGCCGCSRSADSPRVLGATFRKANANACSSPAPSPRTPPC
jgi:iron complex transport system ATP-binding protein